MRRAQSYPCCFCSTTSEKRATAQAHLKRVHFAKTAVVRKPKGITIRATIGVDVGAHAVNLDFAKAINLEDGVYDVTFRAVE